MKERKAVIAGAGVMGASLAQVYALAGYETFVWNRSEAGLARCRELIAINMNTLVSEGLIGAGEAEATRERMHFVTEKDCFRDCGIVVETIVEQMDVKKDFFAEISALVPEEALLATNTSGLCVSEIATAVRRPERFMGQHWLNPPHLLPLCEIVVAEKTGEAYLKRMKELVLGLGKQPVIVKDIRGFLINRLQYAMLREALHIVEIGAATPEDIDTVLKAGMGLRYAVLGPFGVADFGGLDTFDRITRYLNAELCDAKEGSPLLHEMVLDGRLGVKSGAGFYDYSGDKKEAAIRERDRKYIELAKLLYFDSKETPDGERREETE